MKNQIRKNRFATRFNDVNENQDFYPTPPYATECLMRRERFSGYIWECACGDGSMSNILERYNDVHSTDLIDRGYGARFDFLGETTGLTENIVTNPPYKYAEEFIDRALKSASRKVAMLLRISFLESQGRYKLFTETPLKCVYIFSKRLKIYKNGVIGNSGMVGYAWYVWEKGYKGKPYLEWIND